MPFLLTTECQSPEKHSHGTLSEENWKDTNGVEVDYCPQQAGDDLTQRVFFQKYTCSKDHGCYHAMPAARWSSEQWVHMPFKDLGLTLGFCGCRCTQKLV